MRGVWVFCMDGMDVTGVEHWSEFTLLGHSRASSLVLLSHERK
jgi:hypothetical protein